MYPTLVKGNRIIINKLAYGSRLPITPFYLETIQLPYWRLPGYSSINYNDIIVFNLPDNTKETAINYKKEYVKRCVALPGDTLVMDSGSIRINNKTEIIHPSVWYSYTLQTSKIIDSTFLTNHYAKQLHLDVSELKTYSIYLTTSEADSLLKLTSTNSITRHLIEKQEYTPQYYPHFPSVKWNLDFFGPLLIPKKGQKIVLSAYNLTLYKSLIENYENNLLEQKQDGIYLNGQKADSYIFKYDYYFVLGDNRYNSIDSRYWGLVPESHIIGKVSAVLPF